MKSFVDNEFIIQKFTQHSKMVFRIAFHNTSNIAEAEDITQDVFLKLMKEKNKFTDEEYCKAWLIRVTINRCKDYLKSSRHKRNIPFSEENLDTAHYKSDYFNAEDNQVLAEISKLPLKQKNVICLYYLIGYKISEIASILNTNENTVRSWLRRAKIKLKFNMEGEEQYELREL